MLCWYHVEAMAKLRSERSFLLRVQVTSEGTGYFTTAAAAAAKSLQSCPTLCGPIDDSLPGSSAHGIFQGRVLEWGAIAFSDSGVRITIFLIMKSKMVLFLYFLLNSYLPMFSCSPRVSSSSLLL